MSITDYDNPDSLASKARQRRMETLMSFVSAVARENKPFRILDVGGTYGYWQRVPADFLERHRVEIVLLNLEPPPLPPRLRCFSAIAGNACELTGIGNKSFDLAHSNSVIEHVGSWASMKAMANEMQRVGKSIFVQKPYFWFPIEPHFVAPFLHWLPMSLRYKLALKMSLGNWPRARTVDEAVRAQQSAVLLDRSMMRELFPGATLQFERFLGLPKSIIATRQ
jgi:hypothetical protein